MKNKIRITINNIRVYYRAGENRFDEEALEKASALIRKKTGIRPSELKIAKKSIDARRQISFVYSVYAEIESSARQIQDPDIKMFSEPELHPELGTKKMEHRPIIVGFGPAGMFAGLVLAEYGYAPIILERGASVPERVEAVEKFIREGSLDTNTNIQFGAGGAGTFSDGKLTTRINDPLIAYVLSALCELGAPRDILYKAKPHIGTDVLRRVVMNADKKITSLGGDIYYKTTAHDIGDHTLTAGGERIPYDSLVLATGHSARDTYFELMRDGYSLEAKPFSVGVRAEHLQADIDRAMFRECAGDPVLGHAEYQLSYREGERGCYSFCMCPGGTVVPSASEDGGVVTNGMSTRARDGKNANAAICVSVNPSDYGGDPTGAIRFQRDLERRAFLAGGGDYTAPMQTVGDLLCGKSGSEYGRIVPTYRDGKVKPCDLRTIFPTFVCDMLTSGFGHFAKIIDGYSDADVPLTGVETRTSAPVRIMRGEDLLAYGQNGVYPCGEGAGYAGGIVSAAVDGIRVALKIISQYAPK